MEVVACWQKIMATSASADEFSFGKISLQMIRVFEPCFSSALIAYIEVTVYNDEDKQDHTRLTALTVFKSC
jgi:hypothetical protein